MHQDTIKELLDRTFSKLACPVQGYGTYAELEKALLEAYNIGKIHQEHQHRIRHRDEAVFAFPHV